MRFRMYLTESSTSDDEKSRLREIIRHLIANDKPWLDTQQISVKDAGTYWVLNYGIEGHNDYNRLVRGMVIQKPDINFRGDELNLIRSFPMMRFFNRHEGPADPVNLGNAEMMEKLDGTMVGVFFPEGDATRPEWHTRKMVSTHEPDMKMRISAFRGGTYTFMPLIGQYVKALPFNQDDIEYTYVFEFIHSASQVLTQYTEDDFGLHLIAARHLPTHRELNEDELDAIANRLGVKRPKRWDSVADHDQILSMMKQAEKDLGRKDFEGYVFRDKTTGKRVKIKDPDYVRKHKMIDSLSYANLIPQWLQGETDEILAYFPHAKDKIDDISKAYNDYIDYVVGKIQEWQSKPFRGRELAEKMKGRPAKRWDKAAKGPTPAIQPEESDSFVAAKVLENIDSDEATIRQRIHKELSDMAIGHNLNPKKLIDLIGLRDDASGE